MTPEIFIRKVSPNDGQYTIDSDNNLMSILNLSGTPTITVADFPSDEGYQAQLKIILSGSGFIKEGPGTLQVGGGSGTIENGVEVNSDGTLSPGESIGTLSMGELTLKAGSTTVMEVNASSATSDLVSWSDDAVYAGEQPFRNTGSGPDVSDL